jgi:hypothetical protein
LREVGPPVREGSFCLLPRILNVELIEYRVDLLGLDLLWPIFLIPQEDVAEEVSHALSWVSLHDDIYVAEAAVAIAD